MEKKEIERIKGKKDEEAKNLDRHAALPFFSFRVPREILSFFISSYYPPLLLVREQSQDGTKV